MTRFSSFPDRGGLAVASDTPLATVGSWAAAGELPGPRYWAVPTDGAVLLDDDDRQVLVSGGEDGGRNALDTTAVFNPRDKKWTTKGPLTLSRRLHTQTKLLDGKVLVAGGITGPFSLPATPVASAEIYDPATGAWTATAGGMHEARFSHSATLLKSGKVLFTGGIAPRDAQSSMALASAEIFDPETREWTPLPEPMHDARAGHPAVRLDDGRVLVVGGMAVIGRGLYTGLAYCEIFDPGTGKWTPTGSLSSVHKGHQATLLADKTVFVTGGDSPGRQDWTFHPYSQWTTERYNPSTGKWSSAEDMSTGRSHHRAVTLRSGKLLVIGGTDDATFDVGYQNAEIYDPAARTWTATGGMVVGRWAFAAVELADGGVLAAGGLTRSGAATPDNLDLATATSELFTA